MQPVEKKEDFAFSVENFRAIAIIFVMLSHFGSLKVFGEAGRYMRFLFVDATTWFIFISGYLFACVELRKNFDYIGYIKKKIKYVILPYLLLLTPAIIAGIYYLQPVSYGLTVSKYIAWSIVVGGNIIAPMWFIPMIFIFFTFSFVLSKLKSGIFFYVATIVMIIYSLYSDRPYANSNPFLSFIHFIGFYLFGMMAWNEKYLIGKISKKEATILITVFIIIFIIACNYWIKSESDMYSIGNHGVLNLVQVGKISLLIALFIWLEKFCNFESKILSYLSKISFGLFFIHGFYISLFSKFIINFTDENILRFMLEILIVMLMSVITVILLKKLLRGYSRYVIGC